MSERSENIEPLRAATVSSDQFTADAVEVYAEEIVRLTTDMLLVSVDERVTYANPAAASFFEPLLHASLVGSPIKDLATVTDDPAFQIFLDTADTSGPHAVDLTLASTAQQRDVILNLSMVTLRTIPLTRLFRFIDISEENALRQDLQRERAYSSAVIDSLPGIFYHFSAQGQLRRWNRNQMVLTGYSDNEARGADFFSFFRTDEAKKVATAFAEVFTEGTGSVEAELLLSDGTSEPFLFIGNRFVDPAGDAGVIGVALPIKDQQAAAEQTKKTMGLLRAQLDNSTEGILIVDNSQQELHWNSRLLDFWNLPAELLERPQSPDFLDPIRAHYISQSAEPDTIKQIIRDVAANPLLEQAGETTLLNGRILRYRTTPLLSEQKRYGRTWMFRDVTEERTAQREVERLAHYDPLTELPNRYFIQKIISDATAKQHAQFGVLSIDLDNFKDINDSYGHEAGDQALVSAARRLEEVLRAIVPEAVLARYGGDEFLALLPGVAETATLSCILADVLTGMQNPADCEITSWSTVSVGGALYPTHACSWEELLKAADIAMYQAKRAGRNRTAIFTEDIAAELRVPVELERELQRAIEKNELSLHYQPKVDAHTGALTGFEALMRWDHSLRGRISPEIFIPLAEKSPLILELGSWALAKACTDAREWLDTGIDVPKVSVNISAQQLTHGDLAREVTEVLQATGLPAHKLELELTETTLARDPELTSQILSSLAQDGVSTAIDDFGTGYSSLSYLSSFSLHTLKIDRSFVTRILDRREDEKIVLATISLAHSLGYRVIAEGVETEAQRDRLRLLGCDEFQGWLFGHPVTSDKVAETVERIGR